jgi:hypothetical protein
LLGGLSSLAALETCHRMPGEGTTGCPENQPIVRLENSGKYAEVPQTGLQLLPVGSCRGYSSICLFGFGKR